jgi:uncharacterized membrane protein YqhA
MVIVGGYETFVSRLNLEGRLDQPVALTRKRRRTQSETLVHGDV